MAYGWADVTRLSEAEGPQLSDPLRRQSRASLGHNCFLRVFDHGTAAATSRVTSQGLQGRPRVARRPSANV
jgi:hypothetical protein